MQCYFGNSVQINTPLHSPNNYNETKKIKEIFIELRELKLENIFI